jgi:chemotaxis protein histidine kinase CheA
MEGDEMQGVVVVEGGSRVSLIVDPIGEEEKIAAKPPEGPLARNGGFSGATVSGKAQVVSILWPSDLSKLGYDLFLTRWKSWRRSWVLQHHQTSEIWIDSCWA